MVNSVRRLQEVKAFLRMSTGLDLRQVGRYGGGNEVGERGAELLEGMPGIPRDEEGGPHFTDWNGRAGLFDTRQLKQMKKDRQQHCFPP